MIASAASVRDGKDEERAMGDEETEEGDVIRPGEETQMVVIVSCALRNGGSIEVRAPRIEARWLRALFTRNADPFAALRAMGFVMVPHENR